VIKSQIIKHIKDKHPEHYKNEFIVPLEEEIKDLVDSLEEFGRVLGFQEYPWHDPIQYIPELDYLDGYGTGDPNNVCYSTKKDTVTKKSKNTVKCNVQLIFQTRPHHRYVAVYKPIQDKSQYQEAISSSIERLEELLSYRTSAAGEQSLRGLFMDELMEKYDFIINLPQEEDDDFQIFAVVKKALKVMNSVVENKLQNVDLFKRKILGGGEHYFRCLSAKTVSSYANTMLKLIFFLYQSGRIDLEKLKDEIEDFEKVSQEEIIKVGQRIANVILDILSKKEEHFYDFARLLGVKSDGTFSPASVIRKQIPHILYYVRICGVYLKESSQIPEDWINYYDSSIPDSPIRIIQELMSYLDKMGETTIASTIYWKTNEANVIDFQAIQISDVSISLDVLRNGVSRAIDNCETMLKKLFAPITPPDIDLGYCDTLNSSVPGKWFISPQMEDSYQSLVNNKIWARKFFVNETWNIEFCRKWIKLCDDLGLLILFITQVVYGQPARASELEKMRLRNEVNTRRSVFIIDKKVCFMQSYHKAQSVTGKDRFIPRFLDRKTSKMFVLFQVFIRQWQQYVFID